MGRWTAGVLCHPSPFYTACRMAFEHVGLFLACSHPSPHYRAPALPSHHAHVQAMSPPYKQFVLCTHAICIVALHSCTFTIQHLLHTALTYFCPSVCPPAPTVPYMSPRQANILPLCADVLEGRKEGRSKKRKGRRRKRHVPI